MQFDNFFSGSLQLLRYYTRHLCPYDSVQRLSLPRIGGTKTSRSLGGTKIAPQMFAQMLTASALSLSLPDDSRGTCCCLPPPLLDKTFMLPVKVLDSSYSYTGSFIFIFFKQPPPWNCFAPGRTSRRRRQLSRVLSPPPTVSVRLSFSKTSSNNQND